MNWYIGQEIVCIKSHSENWVRVGEIHNIFSLRTRMCGCNTILIDIGMTDPRPETKINPYVTCKRCGNIDKFNGIAWFSPELFAPLQTESEEADMKEAIEESLCQPAAL